MTTPSLGASEAPDPFAAPCAIGDILHGKYRVESLLGCGGMAWVFEATHIPLDARVALKVLRLNPDGDNSDAIARFRREAQAAARMSSEATARVLDVAELDGDVPFMVMERLEGCDLETVAEGHAALPQATAVDYVLQACEGLAEAHAAGIVHRDIKPSNLFLTRGADGTVRVKLIDFGVSRFVIPLGSHGELTQTRALIGSPTYMSPEQMRSSRRVDSRTDIWSTGVVLYALLSHGRSPFEARTLPEICAHVMDGEPKSLRSVRPDATRALERVILRCLEKDPARRFQTVADLATALVPFGPAGSDSRAERIRRIVGANAASIARKRPVWRRPYVTAVVGALIGLGLRATNAPPSGAGAELDRAETVSIPVQAPATRDEPRRAGPGAPDAPSAAPPQLFASTSAPEDFEARAPRRSEPVAHAAAGRLRVSAALRGTVRGERNVVALAHEGEVDVPEFGSRE